MKISIGQWNFDEHEARMIYRELKELFEPAECKAIYPRYEGGKTIHDPLRIIYDGPHRIQTTARDGGA